MQDSLTILLNIINTISQTIIAFSAIIAIIITLKQIGNRKNPKMILEYYCGIGMSAKNIFVPDITIKMINVGISPIYIEYCGIDFPKGLLNNNAPVLLQQIIKL